MTVRPTIRCLNEDLDLKLPPIDTPLNEIDHPLIRKANEQFDQPTGPRERIRSVDDAVLFKVKIQRWRGAVVDENEPHWLVAAGIREAGSPDDFYEALAAAAKSARARYNTESRQPLATNTCCLSWLPTDDDRDRYKAEDGIRLLRRLRAAVRDLACGSLLDGHEHATGIAGAELGLQIKGTDLETYVAVRIVGSVPPNLLAVILAEVPGCDRDGWYPEFTMPDRPLKPGEQVYSNVMDTAAAAQLLAERED